MKINKARLIISAFLTILGSLFLFTTTDREFINLQPTEGASHAIVLDSSKTYQQTFTATRPSISQLGLFLSPPPINTPSNNISIIVSDHSVLANVLSFVSAITFSLMIQLINILLLCLIINEMNILSWKRDHYICILQC